MTSVISVEGLSKKYIIGHQKQERYTTLRDVLTEGAKHFTHKLIHPFATPESDPTHEEFWALKDVSFDIKQGDRVGIIGRNGAGKSTLLKILSRITEPTSGKISIRGRVASLLEVGTGFHPELTGRENIFLNGAILGMSRAEIKNKFDEIVAFAEIERFLDTPVKRYSSGMYVRLAFAVAAHLEPEILIVDEVLAVGDMNFQKKCLGKMRNIASEGRTVLFVSHNMASINRLCEKGLILRRGEVALTGDVRDVVRYYVDSSDSGPIEHYDNEDPSLVSDILSIRVVRRNGETASTFGIEDTIQLEFRIRVSKIHSAAVIGFRVHDQLDRNIFSSQAVFADYRSNSDSYCFRVTIPSHFLAPNIYRISTALHIPNVEAIRKLDSIVGFSVEDTCTDFHKYSRINYGCVIDNCSWKLANEDPSD